MSTYKPFTTSDVVVTPFKVNKSFTFEGASEFTASDSGIDRYFGKNLTPTLFVSGSFPSGEINTYNQELVYRSIRQLYYSNYLRGMDGSPVITASFNTDGTITGGAGTDNPSYYNYLSDTLDANRLFPQDIDDRIGVISIPSKVFGEYIKPGTFTFSYVGTLTSGVITDDENGNLFQDGSKVGDLIYQHGIAVITSFGTSITGSVFGTAKYGTGSYSVAGAQTLDDAITSNNVTCSFESTMTIYESQYKCTLLENEFNYSLNPSIITSSSDIGVPLDFVTGSYFEPYITTVGLYNNSKELLAIGKMAQPLQSSDVTDTTILINLDR